MDIHEYTQPHEDSGTVCDYSQTYLDIKDGDILIVNNGKEKVIGVMVKAWPTAITMEHGHFHAIKNNASYTQLVGEYPAAFTKANEIAHERGWMVQHPSYSK